MIDIKELERFSALANLKKLDPAKGPDHAEEMWHIIRSLACLDFALANHDPDKPHSEKHMEQYATIMRKVQQLARVVQEEQQGAGAPAVN